MGEDESRAVAIPPGHVLLHIGLPKSGTTALQTAAAGRRRELRHAGVRYPGVGINQRLALSAAIGREATGSSRSARASDWRGLVAEVKRARERVLLSYELVCAASEREAAVIVRDLGPERTHVVITVRAQASMLPSVWQQYVKTNVRLTFDEWARAVLGDEPDPDVTPSFWLRHDLGEVCARWASVVGPDRVTVIVLDRDRPELLAQTFGGLLDVDPSLLEPERDGASENRSLTYPEIELVRRLQDRARSGRLSERWRSELIMHGVAPALQSRRASKVDRARVPVAEWVDAAARAQARSSVARVRELRVRVVGDLGVLAEGGRTVPDAEVDGPPRRISVAAVAAAVAGVADVALPSRPHAAAEAPVGSAAAKVRAALVDLRGEDWVRRHAGVLRGLDDAQPGLTIEPARVTRTISMGAAAALVSGVISRTAGRGTLFEARRRWVGDPREVVRWLWVRWRRGHLGRILKGLGPGI